MNRLTDIIRADHRELQAYYDHLVNSDDPDEQTRFQNQLTWGLARHVVGEELVLFPALDKYLGPGEATQDRRQNQIIKEKLQVFQDLKSSDPRFIPTLTILMDDLASHAKDEEDKDLVKLEGAVTAEESKRLAKSFGRTKWFAPTRAHPDLPDPPYQTVVGLMTAPVDYLQDLFRKWPDPEDLPQLD
ncbi:uncharacterized protein N7496_005789 [Penicillium cataractarum]|uniref:Hemerythrin-like domain-containing protein n=1 Tax=Penicillium cataractarum TaxID=2100454 RepID=A0A9W9S0A8_9EURO|nr:uncharacterized protein N7496_005789 [Penicillium cataractarum]KAJ5369697.1 hypothetical protein N7496_005789 [Penicillium cataractarum]